MNKNLGKSLAVALILGALIGVVYLVPAREMAIELIDRIRGYGAAAPIIFFFVYVVAGVTGFSRSVLAIIAGIVFEPVVAFSVVLASSMAAFMCTFVLARRFAAGWVAARLEKIPTAKNLLAAVEDNCFRMLVLMRLNPFVPGFVNGYGFGITSIKPLTYFLASIVGSLPLTLIYTYLGWFGGEAVLRGGAKAEALQDGTMVFGAVLSILMLLAITWYGRRVIAEIGARG